MTRNVATLKIRLMEEGDIEPLAISLGFSQRHIETRWQERLSGYRTIFVAEMDDILAGSVSFDERPDFPGLLHLFALEVAKPLQRRGIGSALVAAVEAEARQRHLDGVYLAVAVDNFNAICLYQRLGYRPEGEPFINRWKEYDPHGSEQEVAVPCYHMFKRFPPEA